MTYFHKNKRIVNLRRVNTCFENYKIFVYHLITIEFLYTFIKTIIYPFTTMKMKMPKKNPFTHIESLKTLRNEIGNDIVVP